MLLASLQIHLQAKRKHTLDQSFFGFENKFEKNLEFEKMEKITLSDFLKILKDTLIQGKRNKKDSIEQVKEKRRLTVSQLYLTAIS